VVGFAPYSSRVIFGGRTRDVVVDVVRMGAGVCGVVVVTAAVLLWSPLDSLRTSGVWEGLVLVSAFAVVVDALVVSTRWLTRRLVPSARLRAQVRAEHERAWREFERLPQDADLGALAAISASLAAAAWDAGTPLARTVTIAGYLAGNEAETHLFGLDRLAFCCRADGSVPIAPAQRLADAEALAALGASLLPDNSFTAGSLALVRLAQDRRAEAAALVRPHVTDGGDVWAAQVRALLAVALLDDDPDAALREARTAWETLDEEQRGARGSDTVAHALAYVERRTATAGA
jgi:hypothetical protein